MTLVPGAVEWLSKLEAAGHRIVLATARPRSLQWELESWLRQHLVFWHDLVMECTSGHRYIVNDTTGRPRCSAMNVIRNQGLGWPKVEGTRGVLLAAGASTRMPNKLMLSTREGRPVVESGIRLLERSGCETITVVVSPDSLIPDLVKCDTVVQPEPLGVCDAIKVANITGRTIIAFGDNVYPEDEVVPAWLAPCAASIRFLPYRNQLDGWNRTWVARDEYPAWKLAGWYVVDRVIEELSSIEYLNCLNAMPFITKADGWYDIGTEEAYQEYLKNEPIH